MTRRPFLAALVLALLGASSPEFPRQSAPPISVCFAPGTSQEYMDEVAAKAQDPMRASFQASDFMRWSATAVDGFGLSQGDPTTLTWAIVPDGTFVPGGVGEAGSPSDLRAYLNGIYGNPSVWFPLFERVFSRWGELTGVTYVHETADDGRALGTAAGQRGVRADIRIGGHRVDGSSGVLAYNAFPNDGDMTIDTASTLFRSRGSNSRLLRNVVAHEHGHGLALDHVCPRNGTKLMEPSASSAFDGPQHDDILGAQRLYGDGYEPNDTSPAATYLGEPGSKKFHVRNASIDDDRDTDWYSVVVPEGTSADITLRPVGRQYDQGPEGPGGCDGSRPRVDTRNIVDLKVALFAPDASLIVSANDTGPGEEEELLDVPLPAGAGTYLVRVRGSGENAAQLYELEMRFVDRGEKPLANDDTDDTWEVLPVTTDVLANDEGLADDPISVRVIQKPLHGKVKIAGDSPVYIPDAGFAGEDSYVYEVSDAHGQTSTAAVDVSVRASARAGNARVDTDGDGYPDEFEVAVGTSPVDPDSRPGDDLAETPPEELVLTKLVIERKSHKPLKDRVVLRGRLPVELGFDPQGARVVVSVAGIFRDFTLDARGRGALPPGDTFNLRVARRRGVVQPGMTRFEMKITRGDFADLLEDEGMDTSRRQRREPRAATLFVLFAGRTYVLTAPLTYTARRLRGGKVRLAK